MAKHKAHHLHVFSYTSCVDCDNQCINHCALLAVVRTRRFGHHIGAQMERANKEGAAAAAAAVSNNKRCIVHKSYPKGKHKRENTSQTESQTESIREQMAGGITKLQAKKHVWYKEGNNWQENGKTGVKTRVLQSIRTASRERRWRVSSLQGGEYNVFFPKLTNPSNVHAGVGGGGKERVEDS